MKSDQTFRLSGKTTVLTPEADGLGPLKDCIGLGRSILARQTQVGCITGRDDGTQWLYCETAGSSGHPKIIRRRPRTWISSFELNAETYGITSAATYVTLGATGHSLALFATLEAFHLGADLCALGGSSPRTQCQKIEAFGVSVIYATPTQLRLLLDGARSAGIERFPRVSLIFSGGGKLDGALRDRLAQFFPAARVFEFFGASETSFITMSDEDTPERSVGRPYPGVSLRVGPAPGAAPMETGEIWISSPYLFDGYETGGSDDTRRDGRYLSIGEMGYLDSDGHLYLKGRKTRMVTVADRNIFPEDIERVVTQVPGVEHCAALAVPDALRGNRIICVVQGAGGQVQEKKLRQLCRVHLGDHAVPRQFVFVDVLPLLAAGKPDLKRLQRTLEDMP